MFGKQLIHAVMASTSAFPHFSLSKKKLGQTLPTSPGGLDPSPFFFGSSAPSTVTCFSERTTSAARIPEGERMMSDGVPGFLSFLGILVTSADNLSYVCLEHLLLALIQRTATHESARIEEANPVSVVPETPPLNEETPLRMPTRFSINLSTRA